MTSAKAMIDVATKEIGTIEGPRDNETKYGKFTNANFLPWCGSFVMWCADQIGIKIPNVVGTQAGAQAFKKQNRWQMAAQATPMAGDLAFMDFPHDGLDRISHIGIVIQDNGDGTVTTIEGNTAPDKVGDQRNGGQVCKKIRAYKTPNRSKLKKSLPVTIVGFGRPKYKE